MGGCVVGMKKMIINHIEKLFVTSDAAVIMNELEVAHPAARMIVMAAKQMEQEVPETLATYTNQLTIPRLATTPTLW